MAIHGPFTSTLEPMGAADPNSARKEIFRKRNTIALGAPQEIKVCSCDCLLCVQKRKLIRSPVFLLISWPLRKWRAASHRRDVIARERRAQALVAAWREFELEDK